MTLDELTYQINGCAMKVHRALGNGFQEVIYQRSLAIELEENGIPFEREVEANIYYNNKLVGSRRVDFIIKKDIMVELKATIQLENVHLAQAKNYLIAYKLPLGLLINFGNTSLQFKKIYNPNFQISTPYQNAQ